MCTNKTLNRHINKWHELKEQERRIKEAIAKESEYIIAELDDRNKDRFGTVRIQERHREQPSKALVMNKYPHIWDEIKIISDSRFLVKC